MIAIVLLLMLAIGVVGFVLGAWKSGNSTADDGSPMASGLRVTLMTYLLVICVSLLYLLTKLVFLDFPDRALTVEGPASDTDITALSKASGPVIFQTFAYLKSAATPGGAPTYEIAIYGDHFQKDAKVRFSGEAHTPKSLLADDLIRVVPENRVLENVGSVTVEVENPDHVLSNAVSVRITRPRSTLRAFLVQVPITREIQLLLMVLCAGALGSLLHAMKSLADFIGNRTAITSWFWWYISRPFLGATMALIFYAVLRGGFLTGTPADIGVVNPFGAVAIAALVGMFSDKASQKLAEVFETLFRSDDKRGGRLAGPVIDKLLPSTVRSGSTAPVEVKVIGDHLGKVTAVKVNGVDRAPDKVEERQVVFKLMAADMATVATLSITVVSPDGTAPAAKLRVSDLDITTTSPLTPGTTSAAYTTKLQATGGKTKLKWSMPDGPAGLKIDERSGEITGTPKTAGSYKPTIVVTDAEGATVSRVFDLVIT